MNVLALWLYDSITQSFQEYTPLLSVHLENPLGLLVNVKSYVKSPS